MESVLYAPIVFFTYNRASHARKAIESLLNNKEAALTDIYIYSDGAKNETDIESVKEDREYIHQISGFKSVNIVERDRNWGLANSLIDGITKVVNEYGRVIVVEDDLIMSPYFLKFMNEALDKYENDDRVSAVSAYVFPVKQRLPEFFFLRYFACWGWATWKRGWDLFNPDVEDLISQFKNSQQKRLFDVDNSYSFYDMLLLQKEGKINSWACRFYASSFLAEKLILYPGRSLTLQNGMDGSGVHCSSSNDYDIVMSPTAIDLSGETTIVMSKKVFVAYRRLFLKLSRRDWRSVMERNLKYCVMGVRYRICLLLKILRNEK